MLARRDLDVVAIGASAGGVAALPAVLSVLPADFPAAIIVVQHLAPQHRSFLAAILARACRLPAREAVSGDIILPGVIYVAPPAAHLELKGGELTLSDAAPVHYARPSIDVLFATVAAACGPHAIGVILTGAGVDGAAGLRAIKRAGGRTIVQEPTTAEYASMPSAASATGCADLMLPLTSIGAALAGLIAAPEPTDG